MIEPPQHDFSSIYGSHAPYVRRVLMRRGVRTADLDDAVQEVFVVVHRQLPSFEGRARIETWLHSVAWRVAASYRRRQDAHVVLSSGGPNAPAEVVAGVETPLPIPGGRLRALLNEIDEQHRDLLALHEIGGLSISELSDLTGNARATIRHQLERARGALGRRIWSALTSRDEEAWLARLGPRFEQERLQLPMARPILCERNALSCCGDTAIAVWRGQNSVAAIEALLPIMFAIAEAEGSLRFLSVIDPSSTPPVRQGRELNAWGVAKLGPAIRAAAWVAESSLLTTLVAPIMNTTLFLAGVPLNARFFDQLAPASSWLGEHGPSDGAAIAAHVERMRKCLTDAGIH